MNPRGSLQPAAAPAWGRAAARGRSGARTGALRLAGRSTLGLKLAGGLALLGTWEWVAREFAPRYVAKPSTVLAAIPTMLADPAFLHAAWATLSAVMEGLAIALVAGTLVGLAMGRVQLVNRFLQFYVNGLYAMPMVAVLPPFALWFGFTGATRLAIVVFAAFFPIALNASDGARSVPPEYLEVGRAYRARWPHVWLGITLPASIPYLLAGIRLAAGRALVGAVVAEFYVSIEGLGFFILFKTRTFHHDEAFVAVLLLAAFGVGFDALMNALTRRALPWYRRETHGV
jgi:NitT/TauT family transport system permease protein